MAMMTSRKVSYNGTVGEIAGNAKIFNRASYVGRFAPSPTGPLHFGSLVAALASYLDARAHGGRWLVRMEDVDRPRCVAGADSMILEQLKSYGLNWDGEVVYQSQRTPLYDAALDRVAAHLFGCACSRQDTHCRCEAGLPEGRAARSVKVRHPDGEPFIVRRADGLYSYQLAVVVDDEAQGITHVVRGADLAEATPRQLYLQKLLGYRHPEYLHVPIALAAGGQKLSKQNRAPAIAPGDVATLRRALEFLGQTAGQQADCGEMVADAVKRWDRRRIPAILSVCVTSP
jgi:glutamyl-Q tRNA(Asp) synthetase